MSIFKKSVVTLASASSGNPIVTTSVVALFYLAFNYLEAMIENLVFGHRFMHWIDPVFAAGFIAYSAYAVYGCALFNSKNERQSTGAAE